MERMEHGQACRVGRAYLPSFEKGRQKGPGEKVDRGKARRWRDPFQLDHSYTNYGNDRSIPSFLPLVDSTRRPFRPIAHVQRQTHYFDPLCDGESANSPLWNGSRLRGSPFWGEEGRDFAGKRKISSNLFLAKYDSYSSSSIRLIINRTWFIINIFTYLNI